MEDYLEYFEQNKKKKLKALTFLKVLKSNHKYSLLELDPKTGRKTPIKKTIISKRLFNCRGSKILFK